MEEMKSRAMASRLFLLPLGFMWSTSLAGAPKVARCRSSVVSVTLVLAGGWHFESNCVYCAASQRGFEVASHNSRIHRYC